MKIASVTAKLITICFLAFACTTAFAGGNEINIDVNEWSLKINKSKIKAGSISFDVLNSGKETHELAIIRLDNKMMADVGKLPVNKHGGIDEDNMNFGEVVGEIEDIVSGNKASKHFKLAPGRYAVVCNIQETEPDGSVEAHYSMGMRALLEVE
ncbi:MAG: hypothetical protein OEZ68_20275 [Gammaproteobacteria bacterium]|nr:hypothetical protein [Gammaproteobacteria bacterium]MDH5803141.1 hypothetical protein [Gammaproteobacteria bacterium]